MNETELLKAYGMAEDELLEGVMDALSLSGWYWHHVRRSDAAIQQGQPGWPDVFAVHPTRGLVIALELKADRGRPTPEQIAWLAAMRGAGVWTALVYPSHYDAILELVLDRGDARGMTQAQLVADEWAIARGQA